MCCADIFAVKTVGMLVVIFLSIRSGDIRQFAKPQVTKRNKLTHTSMVLLFDFSFGFNRSDLNSIIQLINELFNTFDNLSKYLQLCYLVIDSTQRECSGWLEQPDNVKEGLRKLFKERTKGNHYQNYASAFNLSIEAFKTSYGGTKLVVLLITHSREICKVKECLDSTGCCQDFCSACYKNNAEKCSNLYLYPGRVVPVKDLLVTDEADQLKNEGVTLITVGVGDGIDAATLKCWATNSQMYIHLASYSQLPRKGAEDILGLLSGGRPQSEHLTFSSSAKTISPVPKVSITASSKSKSTHLRAWTTPAAHATPNNSITATETISKSNPLAISTNATEDVTEDVNDSLAAGKNDSVQFTWYWWILTAAGIVIVALIIILLLIGAIVCWCERKKRAFNPIVHPIDDGPAATRPQKIFGDPGSKFAVNAVYSMQRSGLIKDPYLVIDQSIAQECDGSEDSSSSSSPKRQPALTRSIDPNLRNSGKRFAHIRHDKTASGVDTTRRTGSTSVKSKEPKVYNIAKKAATISSLKMLTPTSTKGYKASWQKRTVPGESALKYETVDAKLSDKIRRILLGKNTKPLMAPAVPPSYHSTIFKTLK